MTLKRTIRQGQLVSPFGVGSIVDIGPESFVIADISRWNMEGMRRIEDNRLEGKLGRTIRTPAGKEHTTSIAISRFPKWHFCPKCRAMRFVTSNEDEARDFPIPKCEKCGPKVEMTPMGFVSVCKGGHIGDVDWHKWAHRGSRVAHGTCSRKGASLYFETSGQGGGDWAAIKVRCDCGASNHFAGLVQVESPGGMKCQGRQPWAKGASGCNENLWVFRRAASNLHFPNAMSALDLAIDQAATVDQHVLSQAWESDTNYKIINALFAALQQDFERVRTESEARIEAFAERNGCSMDAAVAALKLALLGDVRDEDDADSADTSDGSLQQQILGEEWAVLSAGREVNGRSLQIRPAPPADDWPRELRRTIAGVSMIRRLREVRALLGFRRLSPSDENTLVPVDLGRTGARWYPGVEAWGEGIFLRLSEEEVRKWEERCSVGLHKRLEAIAQRAAGMGWDGEFGTPRFMLLHTLAHAILRRLSFDAGYSASSIRERIYSSSKGQGMCGILLFTADGDSEGSLGGLVRMGDPGRFGRLLFTALQDTAWCSADPVCRETENAGMDGLNAAACHACVLVSETSCSYNNCLLDRRMLVKIGEVEPFFDLDNLRDDNTGNDG